MTARTRRRWLAHCSLGVAAAALAGAMPALAAVSAKRTILVVGDSLSAEYGLVRGSGWVALLEQRLARENIGANVVNASISGDTTAGGLARLPTLLRDRKPDLVVLELGGNDALRGLPLEATRANLLAMARLAKAAGAKVVILGMQLPPNYGRAYNADFAGRFERAAKQVGAVLVPFLLKGVADVADPTALFQADRIHPREAAQPTMLENVWPALSPMLE